MAQKLTGDFNIDPSTTSGDELAAILNRLNEALDTMNGSATPPTYAKPGTWWLDTTDVSANPPIIRVKIYYGSDWVEFATINQTTGKISVNGALDLFKDLADTPTSYAGKAGEAAVVNPTANGIIFAPVVSKAGDTMTGQLKGPAGTASNSYVNKGQLPSNNQLPKTADYLTTQNLNSIQTPGFYYQDANANATKARNYPIVNAGSLIVQKAAGITQTYITYSTGLIYARGFYSNKWGAWKAYVYAGMAAHFSTVYATGNITAYSDKRLKEDIVVIPDAIEKVKTIEGVTYTDKETKERRTGLIAQDLQKVLPEAVVEDEDGVLGIAYGNVVGLLVQSIKELEARVKELEAK